KHKKTDTNFSLKPIEELVVLPPVVTCLSFFYMIHQRTLAIGAMSSSPPNGLDFPFFVVVYLSFFWYEGAFFGLGLALQVLLLVIFVESLMGLFDVVHYNDIKFHEIF
ncbi:hypothetical protein ACJX0J_019301, partial [Zea mays]